MSYNISKWKTERLEDLSLPVVALYRHERTDWHPDPPVVINTETGELLFRCGCEEEIKGNLKDNVLTITDLDMAGEGSGTFFDWILLPALKESKGTLEAVIIWERGESIERLTIKDGAATRTDIEL